MFYIEGANFGKFVEMVKGDAATSTASTTT